MINALLCLVTSAMFTAMEVEHDVRSVGALNKNESAGGEGRCGGRRTNARARLRHDDARGKSRLNGTEHVKAGASNASPGEGCRKSKQPYR